MAHDSSLTGMSTETPLNRAENPVARLLSSGAFVLSVVLITTIVAIALGALSEHRHRFDNDEDIYVRVIELFDGPVSFELLRTYGNEPASPAPLFFLVYAGAGKLLGFTYPVYRGLSLVITLLTVLCLWVFLRRSPLHRGHCHFPILLFLFPYIFCMGFSVMAEPLTLLLTVLGICFYLRGLAHNSTAALALGSLAVTAALYVRVHAVSVPIALMVVLLLQRERSAARWCLAALPILLRIPLVLLQDGLTVSREAFSGTKPELAFCPSNINFFLVWLGYLFFPLLWWCSGRRDVKVIVTLGLIPFYVFAAPSFLGPEHAGALRTLFVGLGTSAATAQWALFPAWVIGCYVTVDLIQRIARAQQSSDMFLCATIVLFMISLAFSSVAFERYYQLAVPAIVLLGVRKIDRAGGYVAVAVSHLLFLALAAARLAKDLP